MQEVKTKSMADGKATGISVRWEKGQFCLIVTGKGVVGCGIFNIDVFDEFKMAGALAKGTPERPLIEPEDLLPARISMVSSKARGLGVRKGMTGRQALRKFLAPDRPR
jgi:uncharacterized protein YunC (DUF1805 family)